MKQQYRGPRDGGGMIGPAVNGPGGTWLEPEMLWERRARVMCQEGKLRIARVGQVADTFFSIPARVSVRGVSIRGYVGSDENGFFFRAVHYYRNGYLLAGMNAIHEAALADDGRRGT